MSINNSFLFLTMCIRLLVRTDEEYQQFAAFVCLLARLEQSMGKDTRTSGRGYLRSGSPILIFAGACIANFFLYLYMFLENLCFS